MMQATVIYAWGCVVLCCCAYIVLALVFLPAFKETPLLSKTAHSPTPAAPNAHIATVPRRGQVLTPKPSQVTTIPPDSEATGEEGAAQPTDEEGAGQPTDEEGPGQPTGDEGPGQPTGEEGASQLGGQDVQRSESGDRRHSFMSGSSCMPADEQPRVADAEQRLTPDQEAQQYNFPDASEAVPTERSVDESSQNGRLHCKVEQTKQSAVSSYNGTLGGLQRETQCEPQGEATAIAQERTERGDPDADTSSEESAVASELPASEGEGVEAEAVNDEEATAEALRLKTEGNTCMKAAEWAEAVKKYEHAIDVCPVRNTALAAILFANLAQAHANMNNFEEAAEQASTAIELDKTYPKGFLRRYTANMALGKIHEAYSDLKAACELDPDIRLVKAQELARIQKQSEEKLEQDKAEMMGKLKEFGNWALGKVGMSIDNFKVVQDPQTGSYNIQYQPPTTS